MRKQGVNHILQIFFPKVCPICTEVLDREQEICQDCRKKLKYITEPKCKKCGKIRRNKAAEDDDMDLIIKLTAMHNY